MNEIQMNRRRLQKYHSCEEKGGQGSEICSPGPNTALLPIRAWTQAPTVLPPAGYVVDCQGLGQWL